MNSDEREYDHSISDHLGPLVQVIHGGDPARLVSPRFESGRSAVESVIITTLREALSRRSSSSAGLGHSLASSTDPSGPSGEVVHTRCLIRTLAMAAGIPEIRSLAAQRLEPWLTVSVGKAFFCPLLCQRHSH